MAGSGFYLHVFYGIKLFFTVWYEICMLLHEKYNSRLYLLPVVILEMFYFPKFCMFFT